MPPSQVPADFLSRVNARIDTTAGWFGLADFRVWTLRLAPAAAALALIAVLWPATNTTSTTGLSSSPSASPAVTFPPPSAPDRQQDARAPPLPAAAPYP